MPCFLRIIRLLRIPLPNGLNLSDNKDVERIEENLKRRLNVTTHDKLREKMEYLEEEKLRRLLVEVLEEVKEEKRKYPNNFKELIRVDNRKRWEELTLISAILIPIILGSVIGFSSINLVLSPLRIQSPLQTNLSNTDILGIGVCFFVYTLLFVFSYAFTLSYTKTGEFASFEDI